MKKTKWLALAMALVLMVPMILTGCTPAADSPASSAPAAPASTEAATSEGEAVPAAAATTSQYENLEPVDVSVYNKAPVLTDFVPADCNLSGTKEDGTPWKIAWTSPNNAQESNAIFTKIMEGMAAEYGFELVVTDAQSDPQKQTNDVNSAITQGCDAIVIAPLDPTSQNAVMKRAMEAGLIVINAQEMVADPDSYDYYIGPNDIIAGQQAASMLIDQMPEGGKVVVVEGNPGETCQINRTQGFMGVIQQYPEFEILEIQGALNWSTAEAMSVMESYMSKYSEIDAVFCHWDIGAAACMQAAETAGRLDEMIFVSVDGVQAALDAIATGGQFKGTSMQPVEENTQLNILIALAALNGDGDKIEHQCFVPNICISESNAANFTAPW